MKNLLIITTRYPHKHDEISSIFVKSQVEELRKNFKQVVVISLTPFTPKALTKWMEPKRKKDSLAKNYSYENVSVFFTKNVVLPLKVAKKMKGIKGYQSSKKILDDINFKPDVIHAHFSWPSGYVANELKNDFNVPVVLTVHEDHEWLMEEESEDIIRSVWNEVDWIIRVNKKDLPLLKKYNTRTICIPNGFLHKKFKPLDRTISKSKLNFSSENRIVFTLGKLIERKGFHDLIEAVSNMVGKLEDVIFVIGGDGPDRSKLEEMIKSKGLEEKIRLIGYVDDKDVPKWISASEFFILPSYSEGNPTVLFETIGCGRPFIGSSVGGVPEIITDKGVGEIFEPGNINAITDALDRSLKKTWNEEYIRDYSMQYSWKSISEQIMTIYKSAKDDFK